MVRLVLLSLCCLLFAGCVDSPRTVLPAREVLAQTASTRTLARSDKLDAKMARAMQDRESLSADTIEEAFQYLALPIAEQQENAPEEEADTCPFATDDEEDGSEFDA